MSYLDDSRDSLIGSQDLGLFNSRSLLLAKIHFTHQKRGEFSVLNLRTFRKLNISSQLSCLVGDAVIIYPISGSCFLRPEMEVGLRAGCLLLVGLEWPRVT